MNGSSARLVRIVVGIAWLLISSLTIADDERLKPFVLAATSTDEMANVVSSTRAKIGTAGFDVIGDFSPYDGAHVFVVTSDELQAVAAKTEFGQFGAILRVAVNRAEQDIQVSFTNPVYIANAYRLADDLQSARDALEGALGHVEDFGSKRGLKPKSLRKYHYTFGMEYFDDPYQLATFDSHQQAVDAVINGLATNGIGLGEVYRIELGEDATMFGVSMRGIDEDAKYYDDAFQMSVVDFKEFKSSAYLPYEVLVTGDKVIAQHMRFRMAVHFPDLSMMGKHSFMTLMPSPDAIENALRTLVSAE